MSRIEKIHILTRLDKLKELKSQLENPSNTSEIFMLAFIWGKIESLEEIVKKFNIRF